MRKQQKSDRSYLAITLFTLVVVGGGIIALIYGPLSLFTSLPLLLFGALMIVLLWLLVAGIGRWREKADREYHEAAAKHIAGKGEAREADGEANGTGR